MDKNNGTKFETLKEDPINIPDNTPSFIGTPAHPFPKFLPKKIALIIVILVLSVLIIGGIYQIINLI
jgi:hypothetical protein